MLRLPPERGRLARPLAGTEAGAPYWTDHRPPATGHRPPTTGHRPLATDHWPL